MKHNPATECYEDISNISSHISNSRQKVSHKKKLLTQIVVPCQRPDQQWVALEVAYQGENQGGS